MTKCLPILFALVGSAVVLRADLVLEQQASDTNRTRRAILKLHGDQMRLDQPDDAMSVIVNLKTRDSLTLLATNQTFLRRFGYEVRWEVEQEKKYSGGTNEMLFAPAPARPTGKSAVVNGLATEIYSWNGANGVTETLWVATNFPSFDAIQSELAKVDRFNNTGPHPNAQPELSRLPGMVVKSEMRFRGRTATNSLVSVKLEPVDTALFELPAGYTLWKPAKKEP